ncbi:MAG TPA: methyltransferase domain-containing protein, partial [Streptosporangiaceae bacterium]
MVMGPCGGVRADGRCEVVPEPCVFPAPAQWAEPVPAVPLRAVPLILTDFSSEPYSVRMLTTVARTLAPSCDAVLVGEHQDRPDFPPTLLASMLLDAGVRPWMTLACRDRNRIVLEEELSGLRHLGVDAVLCVTGDARAYDVRPDVTQVFDLDGPRLAALAASIGIAAAVPETPAAPPRHLRAARLAQKQRAGAAVAVLNHDTVASVTAFMSDAVRAGVTIPVIASVAVFTDEPSAAVLSGLPGLELDPAAVRRVLDEPDAVEAGIAAAAREARAMLGIPGVAGVNISGAASARGYEFAAQVKAELAVASGKNATMTRDAMEAEFDTVAEWTAEVAVGLGPEYLVPAACRGSGKPAALDWLLAGLRAGPGDLLVDVGAGLGGPAAYAADRAGVRPVLVEPEPDACRAAARLFGAPVIQGDATALPIADGAVSLAWSLGVLCTAPSREAQLAMLLEMRRVVRPGGRIGLLVYLAVTAELDDPPQGNHFPTSTDLHMLLRRAGLEVLAVADSQDMPEPPAS